MLLITMFYFNVMKFIHLSGYDVELKANVYDVRKCHYDIIKLES